MYRPLSNPNRDHFVTNFNNVVKDTMKREGVSCKIVSDRTGIPRISIHTRLQYNRPWPFYDAILITDFLKIKRKQFTREVKLNG